MREHTHLKIGEFARVGQAYAALYRWVKDNRYHVIDPPRQLRLQRSEHIDTGQYVTEVQFPIKLQARSGAAIQSD